MRNAIIIGLFIIIVTSAETFSAVDNVILDNWNKATVYNNPSCGPKFTIYEAQMITYIDTYHWNYGKGANAGGTISLKKADGTIYGTWKVETKPGMNGVPNAWWIAYPNEVIPAGTYTVEDSDAATWSQNQESNGCGFSKVHGTIPIPTPTPTTVATPTPTPVVTPTPTPTPVAVNSPCTNIWGPLEPVDVPAAGPSQSPGTYALFYAETTESMSTPWVWSNYGDVILKAGKRYYLRFGEYDRPGFFEETQLPPSEEMVTADPNNAIIWNVNTALVARTKYEYCFVPVAGPIVVVTTADQAAADQAAADQAAADQAAADQAVEKTPNVGVIATISMTLIVYVLIRKRQDNR